MAKCKYCKQEMTEGHSCLFDKIQIGGKVYFRLTKDFFAGDKKCHDCGIINDGRGLHHYGCDMERCPACYLQIISCECNKERLISTILE